MQFGSVACVRFIDAARRWAPPSRLLLVIGVPIWVAVVTGILLHSAGHQLDLEVYRLGVRAWLDGSDMYGILSATNSGIALPFIYPPFAAMVLTPLAILPWIAAVITLFALSLLSLAVTLYLALRCTCRCGVPGQQALGAAPSQRRWRCCLSRCWRPSSSGRSTSSSWR